VKPPHAASSVRVDLVFFKWRVNKCLSPSRLWTFLVGQQTDQSPTHGWCLPFLSDWFRMFDPSACQIMQLDVGSKATPSDPGSARGRHSTRTKQCREKASLFTVL